MPGKIGINIPWFHFDIDFGDSQHRPPPWVPLIDNEFVNLKSIGIEVVRWWLLCSGNIYPPIPFFATLSSPPGWQGTPFPAIPGKQVSAEVGQPTRLSDLFLEDFRLMLTRVAEAGLQVIPSLISFNFCFLNEGLNKGGRYGYLKDDAKRELFLSNVLQPLVNIVANEQCSTTRGPVRYKDVVYAFEVMNEPEWCTDTWSPPSWSFRQSNVPYDKMTAFLRRGCQMINAAGLKSTVGYNARSTMFNDSSVPVSIPQFHIYEEDLSDLNVQGVIIGELGFNDETKTPLDVGDRLEHLLRAGAAAVLIWQKAKPGDGALPYASFSAAQRAQLRNAARRLGKTV
jgi:hypothetical protein